MVGIQMTAFDPSLKLHLLVVHSNGSDIGDDERNEKFMCQIQLSQK